MLVVGCNGAVEEEQNIEGQGMLYGQASSISTDISSKEYPHTKPIQIQHAQYDFVPTNEVNVQQHHTIIHLPEGSVRLTREEMANILPDNIVNMLPQKGEQLTPDAIARLVPEGSGLSKEEIINRIRERTPKRETQPTPPQQPQPEVEAPQQPAPDTPVQQPPAQPEVPEEAQPEAPREEAAAEQEQGQGISEIERRVIELTNAERRRQGLPDFQADSELSNVARAKSNDMRANNYFSHTSPTYGSPFDMMRDFGLSYSAAGENIAQGQRSPEEVVQAWMNSEGHRANILSGNFTHIGVGYDANGHYWTQMFISK